MSADEKTRAKPSLTEVEDMPPELDRLLEGVPNEQQHEIKRLFMASFMVLRRMAPEAPIMERLTGEHLTEIIRNAESESRREHRSALENKVFILLVTILGLVFFGFIIIQLKDKPDVMEKVLFAVGGLLAGAFAGYGIGTKKRANDE